MLFFAKSIWRLFNKNQALIATTNNAPITYAWLTVCKNLCTAVDDKATSKKFVISFLTVSGLNLIPTGFCIHALAISIQRADKFEPTATNHDDIIWNFLLTLSHPKNITAINVDSRKKARIASIANGAPKMSPINQE